MPENVLHLGVIGELPEHYVARLNERIIEVPYFRGGQIPAAHELTIAVVRDNRPRDICMFNTRLVTEKGLCRWRCEITVPHLMMHDLGVKRKRSGKGEWKVYRRRGFVAYPRQTHTVQTWYTDALPDTTEICRKLTGFISTLTLREFQTWWRVMEQETTRALAS